MSIRFFSFCALALTALLTTGPASRADDENPVSRIAMSVEELRDIGIAVSGSGVVPFPNTCASAGRPTVTLSKKLVGHFAGRGFSLEALCLGITSDVRYDPESGRQLPLAFVEQIGKLDLDRLFNEFPLNLPDCYRQATPWSDCADNYDTYYGTEVDPPRPDVVKTDRQAELEQFEQIAAQSRRPGVIYTLEEGSGPEILSTNPYIRTFLVTKKLPHGFGYSTRCCEGDDPEAESVDLATYRKKPSVWSLWFDE